MPDEVDDGLKRAVRVDNGGFSPCDFLFHDAVITSEWKVIGRRVV
jgi:hypothetical protein